ncbi:hypothetical protein AYI68_g6003 [Smittium mucronatum]|uniref:Uncharacterized protein n=1 Tax=Smittium mucronatum TaxID=133383 RepID=A0A1R0GSN1_9FUNG|nr:hypothetical protein AYI68_g6003 [Smittium mucronatum]
MGYLKLYSVDAEKKLLKPEKLKISALISEITDTSDDKLANQLADYLDKSEYTPSFNVFNVGNKTLGYQHVYMLDADDSYKGSEEWYQKFTGPSIDAETYIPKPLKKFFVNKVESSFGKTLSIHDFLINYKPLDYSKYPVASASLRNHIALMSIYRDVLANKYQTALIMYPENIKNLPKLSSLALQTVPSDWDTISFCEKPGGFFPNRFKCSSENVPHAVTLNGAQKLMIEIVTDLQANRHEGFGSSDPKPNSIISHASEIDNLAKAKKVVSYNFSIL